MAHIRQSRPDSGLGFQVKVLKHFQVVLSSLGSGGVNHASLLLMDGSHSAVWGVLLSDLR